MNLTLRNPNFKSAQFLNDLTELNVFLFCIKGQNLPKNPKMMSKIGVRVEILKFVTSFICGRLPRQNL